MLNFSKTAKIPELLTAIEALDAATDSVDAETCAAVKALAIARLKTVRKNGATVNIRANVVDALHAQQFEVQIVGRDF